MEKISYFSYKGGSGRSSLAYNTIPLLAKKLGAVPEHPLIVIDMDIDSAGLSFLFHEKVDAFKRENPGAILYTQKIFMGYIPDSRNNAMTKSIWDHLLFRSCVPIGDVYGMEKRSILFIPASTEAKEKLDIESDDTYDLRTEKLDTVMSIFESYRCCGTLFDCPTGRQQTARASLDMSDKIVLVTRITRQFREGTYAYLEWFDDLKSGKTFYIVPNAVPKDKIKFEGVEFDYGLVKQELQSRINYLLRQNDADFSLFRNGMFGVPEVIRFKFQEDILALRSDRTPDEEEAVRAYNVLVDALTE